LDILQLVLQGGSFAVLVWFLHHLVTNTMPQQQKTFEEALDKQLKMSAAALDRQLSTFSGELGKERESRERLTKAVRENTQTQMKACKWPEAPGGGQVSGGNRLEG
jgi:hypothetical protein